MQFLEWFGLVIVSLELGAQIFLRSFFRSHLKLIVRLSVLAVAFGALYFSYAQYHVWELSPVGKYLLPPYESLSYFIGYVGSRYLLPSAIALLAAIVFGLAAWYLNKRYDERFFEREEPTLFALGIFLTGYPGFLFYIPLMLFFGALLAIGYTLTRKGRAPLYYLWLPLAIFAILIKVFLVPREILGQFNL